LITTEEVLEATNGVNVNAVEAPLCGVGLNVVTVAVPVVLSKLC